MPSSIAIGAASYDESAPSGLNRFTGEITRAMLAERPRLTVYTASRSLHAEAGRGGRLIGNRLVARGSSLGNLSRLAWHQWALRRALRADAVDVFYSPLPEGMLFPVLPQVLTVHDLIPCHYPEASPRFRHYYSSVLPRILRASRAVIAMSESTRSDIERMWRLGDVPVHVVHQGYRAELFRPAATERVQAARAAHGLADGPFLLAVADARPHKNLDGVLDAFAKLRPAELRLAVVGVGDSAAIRRKAAARGVDDRVRVLGAVPDEELAGLYGGALALVFPSHYEGFGIPPLEAMASGCPVVASRSSSLPEVCGDAAVYVDAGSVESIAAGMASVAADAALRASLRERGLERATRFSYRTAARRIIEVLETVREQAARRTAAAVAR